ncbi:MAG TPA: hypothetical protein VNA24_27385 [Hyalangium sp.]|jgi:hypothetical protein|nr:hypothetical protein [Hyalangium sp.]
MRRVLTTWVGVTDKAFVALVALALALMLPASTSRPIPLTDSGKKAWVSAAWQSEEPLDEGELPSSPPEESSGQLGNLIEDDEVVHETHVLVVLGLSLKLIPMVQLEPDSLHARELERPPLHTA